MVKSSALAPALLIASFSCGAAVQPPTATIDNGQLKASLYLPDTKNGFYRSIRFDWSGLVSSLEYKGHNYITTWYQDTSPEVVDFEYRGDKIVTGPPSTMVGLPEEFTTTPKMPWGWDEAKVGGTFVKIGVGVLRKTDDKKYSHYTAYPIVDGGKWTVKRTATSVEFTQTLKDAQSGYAYVYTKRVSLTPGKAQLVIDHTLRNTGSKPIAGAVYEHNFTRWDNEPPSPDYQVSFAFQPKVTEPLTGMPVVMNGKTFSFTRPLVDRDAVRVVPEGFGPNASDYDFRIENKKLGIGLHMRGDRPLSQVAIWGIRTAFAVEPFIRYDIQPGKEFTWSLTYDAYTPQQ